MIYLNVYWIGLQLLIFNNDMVSLYSIQEANPIQNKQRLIINKKWGSSVDLGYEGLGNKVLCVPWDNVAFFYIHSVKKSVFSEVIIFKQLPGNEWVDLKIRFRKKS